MRFDPSCGSLLIILGVAVALVPTAKTGAQSEMPDLSRELEMARQVLESAELQNALAYVDRAEEDAVQEWLGLCNAYGPSGDEMHRSRQIYRLFRIHGLE